MLPRANRLHLAADLRRVLRKGRRLAVPYATFHVILAGSGPSRFAVITPKAVGNAVTRHKVARAVRHSWLPLLAEHPNGVELAVRALPGAAEVPVADWSAAGAAAINDATRRA